MVHRGDSIQEVILSSIYIVETIRLLQASLRHETRTLMHQLVFINVIIILMDSALLGIEYASIYVLETVMKGVCYSIKLKLEFAILSRLVKLVRGADRPVFFLDSKRSGRSNVDEDVADFVDTTRTVTDVTRTQRGKNSRVEDIDIECARFEHVESARWRREDEGGKAREDE
jgi:hypothetical protein